jgi:hypothetical protein
MDTPKTMTVEQGQCEIYPDRQTQMCVRVRVLVMQLKPGEPPDEEWIAEGESLYKADLRCGNDGLTRLLKKIDDGTTPPTPRPRKATDGKAAGGA